MTLYSRQCYLRWMCQPSLWAGFRVENHDAVQPSRRMDRLSTATGIPLMRSVILSSCLFTSPLLHSPTLLIPPPLLDCIHLSVALVAHTKYITFFQNKSSFVRPHITRRSLNSRRRPPVRHLYETPSSCETTRRSNYPRSPR